MDLSTDHLEWRELLVHCSRRIGFFVLTVVAMEIRGITLGLLRLMAMQVT
jgi:hypothetical protein